MEKMHASWLPQARRMTRGRLFFVVVGTTLLLGLLHVLNYRSASMSSRPGDFWPMLSQANRNIPLPKWLDNYMPHLYHKDVQLENTLYEKPQMMLRDNLVPTKKYTMWMTSSRGGFGNQQLALFRGLSLAKDMGRIAIVPGLGDVHVQRLYNETAPPERWDTFFDMARFFKDAGWSDFIQREDMKEYCPSNCESREPLHCYTIHHPFDLARAADFSGLDLAQFDLQFEPLPHNMLEGVGLTRAEKIKEFHANRTELDSQLICYDSPFFALDNVEEDLEHCDNCTPYGFAGWVSTQLKSWLEIGRHLRFNDRLHAIADDILWKVGVDPREEFAVLHIRRGDFVKFALAKTSVHDFAVVLERLQVQYREKKVKQLALGGARGKAATDSNAVALRHPLDGARRGRPTATLGRPKLNVLVTTNEDRAEELDAMRKLGWRILNHDELYTAEYGPWYPTVVDFVIQSRAKIFVGDKISTFSELSALRVKEWSQGLVELI